MSLFARASPRFASPTVEWQRCAGDRLAGEPDLVEVHDFPATQPESRSPHGIYDVASNDRFVSVGVDHDTPVFGATSIEAWWKQVGEKSYPKASKLFITADAGGSNRYRSSFGSRSSNG